MVLELKSPPKGAEKYTQERSTRSVLILATIPPLVIDKFSAEGRKKIWSFNIFLVFFLALWKVQRREIKQKQPVSTSERMI